jgi:2'-5' RNA ligase
MQAFVHLTFDAPSQAALREVQQSLKGAGLPHPATLEQDMTPHLTLAGFDEFDKGVLVEALTDDLEETLSFPMTFASLGAFTGESSILFLAPVVTKALLLLHERVYTVVVAHVRDSHAHYAPGAWIPHCTLALGLTSSQLAEGVKQLSDVRLPLQTRVTKVQLVAYPSMSVLATWSLDTSW